MENLSRSLSKKVCNGNGNGVAAKAAYGDDVFGGPAKFGVRTFSPRVEDYGEIFGGFHASRASSIPVLDLPAVDEAEVSFDVGSSKFDYLEVFGGFDGLDFAVSYEELLFDQSKGGDSSSEEAWTPAEAEFLSEETYPSDYSEKFPSLSNVDYHQSFDVIKQFNISYLKANQRSQEDLSDETHITQLHAVPGFTFADDEITPLQKAEFENPLLEMSDDINLSMDFIEGKTGGKQLRKIMSHPPNTGVGIHAFGKDLRPQRGYDKNEMFVTVAEIGLRTQPSQLPPPSRPPPALDVRKGDSSGLLSNLKATRNDSFEGTAGDSSPPFFDVEVDASSSAAASAAVMKEVMEKAEAKLKSAKELMERKKEGLQTRMKLGSKNDVQDKEAKVSEVADGSNNMKDERVQGTFEGDVNGMKFFVGEETQKVMKTPQVVSGSIEGEIFYNVAKTSSEKKHGKGSRSSQESYKTEGPGEWKEATEFFELVRTDKSRKAPQQANTEKILVQTTKTQERGQKERKAAMEPFVQPEENDRKMKAMREDREEGKNEKKSKVVKEARRQEENKKKVSIAQEICKQEENEKKLGVARELEETKKKVTEANEWEEDEILIEVRQKENAVDVKAPMKHREIEQKLKDTNERMKYEKSLSEAHEREENEKRGKESFEREEYEKRLKEAFERTENEKRLKQALEKEENERRLKEFLEREEVEKKQRKAREREENEKRLKEALEREENKKRLKEVLEREENEKKKKEALEREEENEKKLREALKREENEKRLKEAFEKEENERKQKVASEREENERRLREAHEREEVEKRLKEACKQEEIKKRLKEAHKWEESENSFKDAGEGEQSRLHNAHEETLRDENEKKLKLAQGTHVHIKGENLKVSDEVCKLNENKNLQVTQVACKHEVSSVKLEATQEVLIDEETERMKTEPKDGKNEVEVVEKANVRVGDRFKASGMAQGDVQHEEVQSRIEDAIKSLNLGENVKKSGEAVIGIGQTCVEKNTKAPQMASDPKNIEKKLTHEKGERGNNIKRAQVAFNQEEVENGRKMEASQSAISEGKGNTQRTAQQVNTSQGTERKEKNLNEDSYF
ncbi:hypothetical protein L1049_024852 [Liquidambar formosana]|uniref:Uncharacterized protein n=1 Tax=Liquidambar formosana TaxID=63359 RepID=A0AAP0X561_LIQFO